MKRALSLVLIAAMMLSCVPAMAAEINTNTSQSGNTVVQYGVDESYIVTVPDSARIDAEGLGNINVSVSNAMLASNATLKVYITGDSYANGYWYLNSRDNATNKLQYTISKNSVELGANGEVLSVDAGQAWNSTVTAELQLRLEAEVSQAGTYSDTLTFVVDYQKEANLQLNQYGFYYEQPYIATVSIDGAEAEVAYVFYPDGYATAWACGEVELVEATTYTIEGNQIILYNGSRLTIENDGTTLSDATGNLTLTPVVHANDVYGTYTSNVMGVDVVCDEENMTMYQNGAYVDAIPKSLLTWEKGLVYLNDNLYGFYYPDGTMFAMAKNISENGASGMLFVKSTPIPAGVYSYKNNASTVLTLSDELDAALLASQDNWTAQTSQELYARIMNLYGFNIVPMTWGDGMDEATIDQMTVLLSLSDTFTDVFDSSAGTIVIIRVPQGNGSYVYVPLNFFSLLQTGLLTFSVESFGANQAVAQSFENLYYRWHNAAEELQWAVYRGNALPTYTYFINGMTWQQWYDAGYAKSSLVSAAYIYDGHVWADSRGTQMHYQGAPVKASDTIVPGAEYTSVQNAVTFYHQQAGSDEVYEDEVSAGMTWRDLVQAGRGFLVEEKFNIQTVEGIECMFFADMQVYDTEGNPVLPDDVIRATTYQYQ